MRRREKTEPAVGDRPPAHLLRYPVAEQPRDLDGFVDWLRARARWRDRSDLLLPVMGARDRLYANQTPEIPRALLDAELAAPKATPDTTYWRNRP